MWPKYAHGNNKQIQHGDADVPTWSVRQFERRCDGNCIGYIRSDMRTLSALRKKQNKTCRNVSKRIHNRFGANGHIDVVRLFSSLNLVFRRTEFLNLTDVNAATCHTFLFVCASLLACTGNEMPIALRQKENAAVITVGLV